MAVPGLPSIQPFEVGRLRLAQGQAITGAITQTTGQIAEQVSDPAALALEAKLEQAKTKAQKLAVGKEFAVSKLKGRVEATFQNEDQRKQAFEAYKSEISNSKDLEALTKKSVEFNRILDDFDRIADTNKRMGPTETMQGQTLADGQVPGQEQTQAQPISRARTEEQLVPEAVAEDDLGLGRKITAPLISFGPVGAGSSNDVKALFDTERQKFATANLNILATKYKENAGEDASQEGFQQFVNQVAREKSMEDTLLDDKAFGQVAEQFEAVTPQRTREASLERQKLANEATIEAANIAAGRLEGKRTQDIAAKDLEKAQAFGDKKSKANQALLNAGIRGPDRIDFLMLAPEARKGITGATQNLLKEFEENAVKEAVITTLISRTIQTGTPLTLSAGLLVARDLLDDGVINDKFTEETLNASPDVSSMISALKESAPRISQELQRFLDKKKEAGKKPPEEEKKPQPSRTGAPDFNLPPPASLGVTADSVKITRQ